MLKSNKVLDLRELMLVSKYFNTSEDYINIEKTCRNYRGLIERFHYNPIPILENIDRKLFENIVFYHIYSKDQELKFNDDIQETYYWVSETLNPRRAEVSFTINGVNYENIVMIM